MIEKKQRLMKARESSLLQMLDGNLTNCVDTDTPAEMQCFTFWYVFECLCGKTEQMYK